MKKPSVTVDNIDAACASFLTGAPESPPTPKKVKTKIQPLFRQIQSKFEE
jgi:hypothetical protein